jgi:hypothetical protein
MVLIVSRCFGLFDKAFAFCSGNKPKSFWFLEYKQVISDEPTENMPCDICYFSIRVVSIQRASELISMHANMNPPYFYHARAAQFVTAFLK